MRAYCVSKHVSACLPVCACMRVCLCQKNLFVFICAFVLVFVCVCACVRVLVLVSDERRRKITVSIVHTYVHIDPSKLSGKYSLTVAVGPNILLPICRFELSEKYSSSFTFQKEKYWGLRPQSSSAGTVGPDIFLPRLVWTAWLLT